MHVQRAGRSIGTMPNLGKCAPCPTEFAMPARLGSLFLHSIKGWIVVCVRSHAMSRPSASSGFTSSSYALFVGAAIAYESVMLEISQQIQPYCFRAINHVTRETLRRAPRCRIWPGCCGVHFESSI